ncbi:MAG: hypothetical protein KDH16_15680 [Rhodocyclaceae bacterium]|nr:hypothetical protein [Rhodocyclaceae bacterium]
MTASNAPWRTHVSDLGATAEIHHLTQKVKQVALVNRDATNIVYCMVYTNDQSSANAVALAATATTALVDDSFVLMPGERRVVFKSPKPTYVALNLLASGANTDISVEGTPWYD